MLSLYKLEIFAAVVHEGSFSAAGQRLYMTQPAVSQHIQDLEAMLGTLLFTRGRRGVKLTSAGETLYDYTQRILRLVAEAEAAVTNVENLADGQLHIGGTPGVSVYLLPEWVRGYQDRFPNLAISLHTAITSEIVAGVMGRKLEVGFVEGELDGIRANGLGSLSLMPIELFVVVGKGHVWCQRESVSIAELAEQPFITRQPGSQTRQWIDETLRQNDISPRIVAQFDNPESIKQAVMSNMGVTILPDYAVRQETRHNLLRALHIDDVPLQRHLKLVWAMETPFSPITRALLAHLAQYFDAINDLL